MQKQYKRTTKKRHGIAIQLYLKITIILPEMSARFVQEIQCTRCTAEIQCSRCAAATLERVYYCHCDTCKITSMDKPLVDFNEYRSHQRRNMFEGMRYAQWKLTICKSIWYKLQ